MEVYGISVAYHKQLKMELFPYPPPPKCLPNGDTEVPHVFVGDDAFALKRYMMKPYS